MSTSFSATDGQFGKLTDSRLGVLLLVTEAEVDQQPQEAGQEDSNRGELKQSRLNQETRNEASGVTHQS